MPRGSGTENFQFLLQAASDECIPNLQKAHLVIVIVPRVHSCRALPTTPPALPGAYLFFCLSLHTHLTSCFLGSSHCVV